MRRLRAVSLAFGLLVVGVAVGLALSSDAERDPESLLVARPGTEQIVSADQLNVLADVHDVQSEGVDAAEPAPVPEAPEVAAIRFLELTEDVVQISPDAGAAVQRSIAASSASEELAAAVFDSLTQLQAAVPEGTVVHVAPIVLSSAETADGWDVSIWYVEVIIYGDQLAVEHWRTATYSIVEEDGEWRMAGLASSDGPVPTRPGAAVGWSAAALLGATTGFDDELLTP